MWYSKLNNKRLWKIFSEISDIPRESGNEEGIREYLLSWAEQNKIEASSDRKGNVYMKKGATKGMEKLPPVALQAHIDMVCVKKEGSSHDFTKDPIHIKTDGNYIFAADTTLGADDGIGVAIILDILSDPEAKHGPIEGIFTVEEETGLGGAYAIEGDRIQARRLINIDSEEEGILYIGCAGGVDIDATMKLKYEKATGTALAVSVSGLLGGHSGGEIHKERANAISILARYLDRLPSFQIASIAGGTRRNVIPFSAEAVITVSNKDAAISQAKTLQEELSEEFKLTDPGIKLTVTETEMPEMAIKTKKSQKIAGLLFASPTGVKGMSAIIVDRGTPGFSIGKVEDKMGIRGAAVSELVFEDCVVPKTNLIGKEGEGFKIAMSALDGGRIGIAAQALGIAEAAIDASVEYSKQRSQFGKPISALQGIQWYLADMATRTEAAKLLILQAADMRSRGENVTKEAAMAKYFASENAVYVTDRAVQIHGGYGYMKDYPIERMYRDARITPLYEGTSEVQKMVISRAVIGK